MILNSLAIADWFSLKGSDLSLAGLTTPFYGNMTICPQIT